MARVIVALKPPHSIGKVSSISRYVAESKIDREKEGLTGKPAVGVSLIAYAPGVGESVNQR